MAYFVIAARWTGRILSILLLLTVVALAVGEGGPNPFNCSLRENLLGLGLLTMIVGLAVGWKWEGIGGLLILGGFAFFSVVNHRFVVNALIGPWLLAGLLYLACRWVEGK